MDRLTETVGFNCNLLPQLGILTVNMKKSILLVVALVVLMAAPAVCASAETPVVIELFTSEGCSSCPPADALLIELGQKAPPGADLILLGEHVDYWNHDGWKDRFSSAQFTERQGDYARQFHLDSVYSPQIVIDGHLQLIGNKPSQVFEDIEKAAAAQKPAQVSLQWQAPNKLHVAVQNVPPEGKPRVLLAVTEDGLSTAVGGGENGGRTLQHAAVVRQLRELGSARNGKYETNVNVQTHQDWNPAKLKVVVLVQQSDGGKILGAASLDYQAK